MNLIRKIDLIFNPESCPHCGHEHIKEVPTCYIEYVMCEAKYVCKSCEKQVAYWAYGSFDDPLFYMETKWKRFKYLFFGVIE